MTVNKAWILGDKEKFESSNEKFIELANQKNHPTAMVINERFKMVGLSMNLFSI